MKYFFFYLGLLLVALSGAFNYFVFEQIFSSIPAWVQLTAAFLIAALMYGMTWVMSGEDKESTLVWVLCTKISVAATVASIFLSGVSSEHAVETVKAKEFAADATRYAVEQDQVSQGVWMQARRVTHAAEQRMIMDGRLEKFVAAAEDLERHRNGPALMASSLQRVPGGAGPYILGLMSLLLALALDLGQAKCTKIFRRMDEAERLPETKSWASRAQSVEVKERTRAGSYDTGTDEGRNHRYSLVAEALRSRDVAPTVRAVKDAFKCRGSVASGYLSAAADDGIIAVEVGAGGKRSYRNVG